MNTEPEGLALGAIIADKYRLDRLIGQGGFGAVFAATRVGGGRVALKVLSRTVLDQTGGEARFHREADLARRLSHPNTVRVLDAGADRDGLLYIAFELLEGRSVEEALAASGAFAPRRAAEIVIGVLDALEEAHHLGVIHRDMKPANLFLVRAEGVGIERVKVLDFGIAKSTNPNTRAGLTRDGTTIGTPVYMAPEQMLGREVDGRTDLFALAIVLAEMIEGRSPYGDEPSGLAIMTERVSGRAIPFSTALLSSPIGQLLVRATAAEPRDRFASASEMRLALIALLPSLALEPTSTFTTVRSESSTAVGGAVTEVATERSFSGSPSYAAAGGAHELERSPRAASVAMAPRVAPTPLVAPTQGGSLTASEPPYGLYQTPPAPAPYAWPQTQPVPPPSPYAPMMVAPVQKTSSGAAVVLLVVAASVLLLAVGGIAGAVFYLRSAPPKQTTETDGEEPSEPPKKPKPPPTAAPTSTTPTEPRQPRPTPQLPQPRVSAVHERSCPAVDALSPAALGPHVRAAGLVVKADLTMCPGNMVNFECEGPTGKGVTATGPDGSGSVYLLTSKVHSELDQFVVSERANRDDEETLLIGKTQIVVVSFGEPYASRIAQRICH